MVQVNCTHCILQAIFYHNKNIFVFKIIDKISACPFVYGSIIGLRMNHQLNCISLLHKTSPQCCFSLLQNDSKDINMFTCSLLQYGQNEYPFRMNSDSKDINMFILLWSPDPLTATSLQVCMYSWEKLCISIASLFFMLIEWYILAERICWVTMYLG